MKSITVLAGLAALALSGAATAQPVAKVRADADRNGIVSRAEFVAKIDQRFAKLDVNGDGQLTRADRQARRAANPARAERRQANRAQRLARFDTNRDGQLSQTERQAARAQRQAMRGERLAARGGVRRDANGDQAITRAEFQAHALQRFARLDTNRDGQLTRAERQAGKAQRQARRAQRQG